MNNYKRIIMNCILICMMIMVISGCDSGSASKIEPLEIKDYGWVLHGDYLYYYFDIYNPNVEYAIEFPSVSITAFDDDGGLIGTEDHTMNIIYPGQTFTHGTMAFSVDAVPKEVKVEALPPKDYNITKMKAQDIPEPFEIESVNIRSDRVLGNVVNPNNEAYSSVAVTLIGKNSDGDVIWIDDTFIDDVPANGSRPFRADFWDITDLNDVEVSAIKW